MKKQIRPTNIKTEIKASPGKGRGVFAIVPIKAGEAVEIAPALYIEAKDSPFIGSTVLACYTFHDDSGDGEWLALGHASMYNHDSQPLAEWAVGNGVIVIRAIKDIKAGQEITIDYGWDEEFQKQQGIK